MTFRIKVGPLHWPPPQSAWEGVYTNKPALFERHYRATIEAIELLENIELPYDAHRHQTLKDVYGEFFYVFEFLPPDWGGPEKEDALALAAQIEERVREVYPNAHAVVEVSLALPFVGIEAVQKLASYTNSPYPRYAEFAERVVPFLTRDARNASRFRSTLLKIALAILSNWQILYDYNVEARKAGLPRLRYPWEEDNN